MNHKQFFVVYKKKHTNRIEDNIRNLKQFKSEEDLKEYLAANLIKTKDVYDDNEIHLIIELDLVNGTTEILVPRIDDTFTLRLTKRGAFEK